MIHSNGALLPSGPRQPPIDDRDEILGHFAVHLALGETVSAIAARGLLIWAYLPDLNGKPELTVVRHLKGATLERRYRELRKELDDALEWQRVSPMLANASYIGVSAPSAPLSFGANPKLKRGRPRKKRAH